MDNGGERELHKCTHCSNWQASQHGSLQSWKRFRLHVQSSATHTSTLSWKSPNVIRQNHPGFTAALFAANAGFAALLTSQSLAFLKPHLHTSVSTKSLHAAVPCCWILRWRRQLQCRRPLLHLKCRRPLQHLALGCCLAFWGCFCLCHRTATLCILHLCTRSPSWGGQRQHHG